MRFSAHCCLYLQKMAKKCSGTDAFAEECRVRTIVPGKRDGGYPIQRPSLQEPRVKAWEWHTSHKVEPIFIVKAPSTQTFFYLFFTVSGWQSDEEGIRYSSDRIHWAVRIKAVHFDKTPADERGSSALRKDNAFYVTFIQLLTHTIYIHVDAYVYIYIICCILQQSTQPLENW